jgi:hypothetical protein
MLPVKCCQQTYTCGIHVQFFCIEAELTLRYMANLLFIAHNFCFCKLLVTVVVQLAVYQLVHWFCRLDTC